MRLQVTGGRSSRNNIGYTVRTCGMTTSDMTTSSKMSTASKSLFTSHGYASEQKRYERGQFAELIQFIQVTQRAHRILKGRVTYLYFIGSYLLEPIQHRLRFACGVYSIHILASVFTSSALRLLPPTALLRSCCSDH